VVVVKQTVGRNRGDSVGVFRTVWLCAIGQYVHV
jgi:hypothetical protein